MSDLSEFGLTSVPPLGDESLDEVAARALAYAAVLAEALGTLDAIRLTQPRLPLAPAHSAQGEEALVAPLRNRMHSTVSRMMARFSGVRSVQAISLH